MGSWFSGKQGLNVVVASLLFSVVLVILQLFVYIRFGGLRDWIPGVSQWLVMLINPATLTAILFIGWAEMIHRRNSSSRMAAIALFTCSFAALVLFTAVGIWFRGPNWEFYWSASQWPIP